MLHCGTGIAYAICGTDVLYATSGTDLARAAMRCPVLGYGARHSECNQTVRRALAIVLRGCYALSSTDIGDAKRRVRYSYCLCCYAMSSTKIGYAATDIGYVATRARGGRSGLVLECAHQWDFAPANVRVSRTSLPRIQAQKQHLFGIV